MKAENKIQSSPASTIRHAMQPRRRLSRTIAVAAALSGLAAIPASAHVPFTFDMVRSAGVVNAGCVPNAGATVTITPQGPVEIMTVQVRGLPPKTDFDFFVIQVPNAPFGLSWYQGDIETDENGNATQTFIGRFNEETFIVAPGSAPSPFIHNGGLTPQTSSSHGFPDATSNPPTAPVHTYHLGLWFNDFRVAEGVGCPATVTPFNGEHQAGVQVLNTSQFPDTAGPLFTVKP